MKRTVFYDLLLKTMVRKPEWSFDKCHYYATRTLIRRNKRMTQKQKFKKLEKEAKVLINIIKCGNITEEGKQEARMKLFKKKKELIEAMYNK